MKATLRRMARMKGIIIELCPGAQARIEQPTLGLQDQCSNTKLLIDFWR